MTSVVLAQVCTNLSIWKLKGLAEFLISLKKSWWWLNICQGSHVGNITRWKSIFAARKPLTWSWFIIAQGLHIQHNGAPSPCEVAFLNFPTLKTILCFKNNKKTNVLSQSHLPFYRQATYHHLIRRLCNETPKSPIGRQMASFNLLSSKT